MTYLGFPAKQQHEFRQFLRQWWLVAGLLLLGIGLILALLFAPQPLSLTLTATIPVGREPLGITLSPDHSQVYVANAQSGTVSVIDTASHTVVHTITVNPQGRLNSVIISSDGATLYVTDAKSRTVEVFRLPDGQRTATIPVRLFPQGMAFSSDGRELYVVNSASNNVSVIDTTSHTLLANIAVNERPYAIVMAPDGQRAYVTSSQTHSITVLDTAQHAVVETIMLDTMSRLTNAAISPDGKHLYICDAISNSIVVVDTASSTQTHTLSAAQFDDRSDLEFSPTDVALSADGTRLYAVGRTGYVSVIDLEQQTILASLEVGKDLRQIALSSDGTAYMTSFGNNSVRVVQ